MSRDDDQARERLALTAAVAGVAIALPFVLALGARLQAFGAAVARRGAGVAEAVDTASNKKRRKDRAMKKGGPEITDPVAETSRKRAKRQRRADKRRSRKAKADVAGGTQ